MQNNNKALNIKVPEKLYSALKQEAERSNISLASLVRLACSVWLEEKSGGNYASSVSVDEIFDSLQGDIVKGG